MTRTLPAPCPSLEDAERNAVGCALFGHHPAALSDGSGQVCIHCGYPRLAPQMARHIRDWSMIADEAGL